MERERERAETARTAKQPRSEVAAENIPVITVSDLNEVCLQHVFSLVGPGHYIFLSCCKRWQHAYWLYVELNMMTAVEHVVDNFSLFQWAVDAGGGGCPKSADLCASAARSGQLPLLQWLRDGDCEWDNRVCTEAARRGDIAMLRRQGDVLPLLVYAAAAGRVGPIKWARTIGVLGRRAGLIAQMAAENDRLEVLAYMLAAGILEDPAESQAPMLCAQGFSASFLTSPACAAAAHGRVQTLRWLQAHGAFRGSGVCVAAARDGHIHVLEWALANGCEWEERICHIAAEARNMALLAWAEARGCTCRVHRKARYP
ncbi:hypothetical protein JKP88DRAFT_261848 [Tribonema minus]|uniref:Ankyrin repeat protein n=1 Tax=Tribonema minus TaxID=303371 RepID=A0A835ZGN6_9STRA|nr:hypothetical protein JKP88DRAFT_261848 [Tribonema minus]